MFVYGCCGFLYNQYFITKVPAIPASAAILHHFSTALLHCYITVNPRRWSSSCVLCTSLHLISYHDQKWWKPASKMTCFKRSDLCCISLSLTSQNRSSCYHRNGGVSVVCFDSHQNRRCNRLTCLLCTAGVWGTRVTS